MSYKSVAVAAVAALAMPFYASAAEISHEDLGDGLTAIYVNGDIEAGDDVEFKRLAVQIDKAVVVLNSDGGALIPALEIGRAVQLSEYLTFVVENDVCTSACALIWIAGAKRLLAPGAKIGFHASYLDVGGELVETGVGNALVGRYLTQLQLPESAVVFATSAPPTSIRWLRASDEAPSGISFEVLSTDAETAETVPVSRRVEQGGWRIASVSDDMLAVRFVNSGEISRRGDVVQFWEDSWWSKEAGGANRSVSLVQATCDSKAYRYKSTSYYKGDRFVDDGNVSDEIGYAAPGTMLFGAIEAACDRDYLSANIEDRATVVARLRANR